MKRSLSVMIPLPDEIEIDPQERVIITLRKIDKDMNELAKVELVTRSHTIIGS